MIFAEMCIRDSIVSLKKHFVNKLTDGIIVKKNDVYL